MSLRLVDSDSDEETREADFEIFEPQEKIAISIPVSPHSSQGSTPVGTPSVCSDDDRGIIDSTPTFWSRRVSFLRASLVLRPKCQSKEPDDSLMLCPHFSHLQPRLLLERQNESRLLEMQLDVLEANDEKAAYGLMSDHQNSRDSTRLLDDIEDKLTAYRQLLSSMAALTDSKQPMIREQKGVDSWLTDVEPFNKTQTNFHRYTETGTILRLGREHVRFAQSMKRLWQWFCWSSIRRKVQSKNTCVESDGANGLTLRMRSRAENYIATIVIRMTMALMATPLWILYELSQHDISNSRSGSGFLQTISFKCASVLFISTLAFSACINLMAPAKRHEILAASAAYCAVLVVFVENVQFYQRLHRKKGFEMD